MAGVFEKFEQHVITVGTTEVSFPTCLKYGDVGQPESIFVQTPSSNSCPVYIGKTGVKSDLTTGAFEIPIGADTVLPIFNENILKAIASAVGQKLLVTYMAKELR